ncbi:hypothetical protein V502_02104 [Pseudogymnoascus sp. VKM F-4520 (FW-2644)]|nr:hypothetical protein V502_02104 [Pseudogymnoascus sp. VKM F-4520 (FW-2644)]
MFIAALPKAPGPANYPPRQHFLAGAPPTGTGKACRPNRQQLLRDNKQTPISTNTARLSKYRAINTIVTSSLLTWRILRRPCQHPRAASTATSSKPSSQNHSSAVQDAKQHSTALANAKRLTGRATKPPAVFQALPLLPTHHRGLEAATTQALRS